MPYKPLPKPVSERTLQKKYAELAKITHGRIGITTDSGKRSSALLHRYVAAFSNLYGLLPIQTAWDIFCEIEPELVKQKKLLKKDFLAFSAILRSESHPYYILNEQDIWPDESDAKSSNSLIVNKKLVGYGYYRFHDLLTLMDSQGDKPFALLRKEEYFAWAEPGHFRKSFCARDMLRFLETLRVANDSKNCDVNGRPIHGKNLNKFIFWNSDETFWYNNTSRKWEKDALAAENDLIESEKLMQKIERNIQLGDPIISTSFFLKSIAEDLEEVGVRLNEAQFNKLLQLYSNLNNKSSLWCNCGWSPEEMAQMSLLTRSKSSPSISFGPGFQESFSNGEPDRPEIEHLFRKKGFNVLN